MLLWRLSDVRYARLFNGGYGLANLGRWNSVGHAVTYCSTSPALCVLEKLVHVEDPDLMPPLMMVRYDVPDELATEEVALVELPDSMEGAGKFDPGARRPVAWRSPVASPASPFRYRST